MSKKLLRKSAIIGAVAVGAAVGIPAIAGLGEGPQKAAAQQMPTIVATVYDYATNSIGIYRLPIEVDGEFEKLSDVSSYYGGAKYGDLFYACHDGRYEEYWDTDSDPHGHKIQAYDINTWEPVGSEVRFSAYRAGDLAIDPNTGKGWAFCDYGSMMYSLYDLDLTTGESNVHASGSTMLSDESSRALAFNEDGVLYGVTKNGKFGTVSMTDGRVSTIKDLGITGGDLKHGWTADFDPETGNFIFICNRTVGSEEKSEVYSIDPETGNYTVLMEFSGKCITSMYIESNPVAEQAPGMAENLNASFPEGSLSGSVSFTIPATLNDGSEATGNADWSVTLNDEELASGQAAYGSEVNAEVTVAEGGQKSFVVQLSNAAGAGKKAKLVCWVGPDTPNAPAGVEVSYDEANSKFEISWEAVTTGAHEGYVDPAAISYTVIRNLGAVEVATGLTTTNYTDTYTPNGIEEVVYSIVANQGELASAPGVGNAIMCGSLALPYSMYAASEGGYGVGWDWTVFDVNEDGKTFESQYGGMQYSYHSSNPADDWMISAPINGKAGQVFSVKVTAFAQMSSYPEKIEAAIGYEQTPEGMTEKVLEPVTISAGSSNPAIIEFTMSPTQTGKFFLGIHCVSDANQYKLTVKDVQISAPVSNDSPAKIEDLNVTADRSGALKAIISGTAPTLTTEGEELTDMTHVQVLREGVVVGTVENVGPGEEFSFTDETVPEDGEYIYTAQAMNGQNAGPLSEETKIYVGINSPGELFNIQIVETTDAGMVTATWDPASQDWLGYPLNGDVTYKLEVYPDNAYYHGNKIYEGIEECSFTFEPEFADNRDHGFVAVKVWAVNEKGGGYANKSKNIAVGEALSLPFHESFPNYTLEHPWGDGESNGPQVGSISDDERSLSWNQFNGWNRMMDRSFQSADGAQDGDNGFAGMFGWSYADSMTTYHDEYTELLSPKISLAGAESPILSFYLFNWLNQSNGKCMNRMEVIVLEGEERTTVKDITIGDLSDRQAWEYVAVDLSAFSGKTISLIFKGTIIGRNDQGYNWILLDNIKIENLIGTDLGISGFTAPVDAEPGESFTVSAVITNHGVNPVSAHTATLYKNGVEVESKELGALGFSGSESVEFTHALAVTDPIGNNLHIEVSAEGDQNTDNNRTETITVGRNLQLLPEPKEVTLVNETLDLVWQTPDMDNALPAPFTDDFESYGDFENSGLFTTEAGDWEFEDLDGLPIGGIVSASTWEMIEFPGIPTHSVQSWWVQNRYFEEFGNDYFGNSGYQYLANMYVVNEAYNHGEQQDDWAISPRLCGKEQMISFYARSYDRYTPETIELYWSNGSTDPGEFTFIRRIEDMSGDWTRYVFVVPEGAYRFAIRGCSNAEMGTNQTFIDDVTFVPKEGDARNLTLLGYNIYQDGESMNATPVTKLSFEGATAGHTYAVSAVYAEGESRAVEARPGSHVAMIQGGKLRVSTTSDEIIISGLEGAAYIVSDTRGAVVAKGNGLDIVRIPAEKGVYVVKAGNNSAKAIVR